MKKKRGEGGFEEIDKCFMLRRLLIYNIENLNDLAQYSFIATKFM